jgi:hypothetical protein
MKRTGRRAWALAIALVSAAALAGYHAEKEAAAIEAANQWLALVDSGQYAESWERSASLFQDAVSAQRWESMVTAARRPFGALISRRVVSASYTESLPGAPDGQYVVIQYQAEYEKKKKAIETVTPLFEKARWRVSGYFIK